VQDPRRWSTDAIPEDEQFAFWRDVVWEAFVPVSPRRRDDAEGPFAGSVTATALGPLGVARIASESQTVHRTQEQARRVPGDVFFLNLPLTGGTAAGQDGRRAELAGGDFTLVDSTRPFDLEFGRSFEQLSFTIPHAALVPLLGGDPAGVTAVRVRGDRGLGAVASGALRAAAAAGGIPDRGAAGALGDHLVGLVALALGGARAASASGPVGSMTPNLLLALARDEVERSLEDPDLAPADVARRVGVSTRYLHRLFSDAGPSFGRWLLARRLERCHAALADPALAHWTVTQVAFEHGFADPSYFARVFKARYGETPRRRRAAVSRRG
jgi:AraC family transcriptional activator of tynA and feaB